MAKLETTYMGIKLKNPIIVSSSGLTNTIEKIKKIEEAGAGAVVLKSLFEEQINFDAGNYLNQGQNDYPEAEDYVRNYVKNNTVDSYLELIETAKIKTKIPIIASINCVSASDWTSFASKIEKAGADGLELNINIVPTDKEKSSAEIEKTYFEILEKVKASTKLPVAVKIGQQFSNILYLVNQLHYRKADAVVLFNRFYEPDINATKLEMDSASVFSHPSDLRHSLRWIGIISDKIEKIDIAGSTGVHDGEAAFKQILAGASAVQVCSVLYKKGVKEISNIVTELEKWMEKHKFSSIADFKAKMNYSKIGNPLVYQRSQFMKYFSSME
ncbi:MAG: dihydroorotate dehydrogenase-like protein [Bacteroidales bacterium]|nr:dihydroorotate dehydrogenase-like protein [Bacteroidales bacterium]